MLYGQYKVYKKLEILYSKGLYTDCIDKAKKYSENNRNELYPYYWRAKSSLSLISTSNEKKAMLLCNNALNLAVKLFKKDKSNYFFKNHGDFYDGLKQCVLTQAQMLCGSNHEKAEQLHLKLAEILPGPDLLLATYECKKYAHDQNAYKTLQVLLDLSVKEWKENQKVDQSLEIYFSELAVSYYRMGLYEEAFGCLVSNAMLFSKSEISRKFLKQQLFDKADYLNNTIDIGTLIKQRGFLIQIDTFYHFDGNESFFRSVDRNLLVRQLDLAIEADEAAVEFAIRRYFNHFNSGLVDSCNLFFHAYLNRPFHPNQINKKHVFSYWTKAVKFYSRKDMEEATSLVFTFLKNESTAQLLPEYYMYCKSALKGKKTALLQFKDDYEKTIINGITTAGVTEYIQAPIDNGKLQTLVLLKEIELLKKLLATNNYSRFAVVLKSALQLSPGNKELLELKRQFVIADYKAAFAKTKDITTSFYKVNPNVSKCQAGSLNELALKVMSQRINYIRRLAGILDSCVFKTELNRSCQLAALMMDANNNLNHYPARSWKCYSKDGAEAAKSSNLSLGYGFDKALMGQIKDDGKSNTACGHRRWILNPYNRVFGLGSTDNAMSLKVFGNNSYPENKGIEFQDSQFIAWPSADYFPLPLVPERWSFSLNGADFSKCKIEVMVNGKSVHVSKEPLAIGYGLNTVVWTLKETIIENTTYSVRISNVILGNKSNKNYAYKVVFLKTD